MLRGAVMDVALHDLVAAIYTGAFEFSFEHFKERSLQLVEAVVPFASAAWGTGLRSSNTMLTVATCRLPAERMIEYGLRWQNDDFVRRSALARPGVAIRIEDEMPLAAYRETAIYREFSRPAGIEYSLAAAYADPGTDLVELICLFRSDPETPFDDEERATIEALTPHLGRAWQHRQIIHGLDAGGTDDARADDARGHAVIDRYGVVQAANLQFTAALRRAVRGWHGPSLPPALQAVVDGPDDLGAFAGMQVRILRGADRHLVTLAAMEAEEPLTSAEMRVAELYASGVSNQAIARAFGVSPSTVRNQIAAVYRKMGIHSKAELARRIPSAGPAPPDDA